MSQLKIKDLHVSVEEKEILKGINLEINEGETHALLGPNGHGKSTLLNVIMGHPNYKVTSGSITFDGEDVLKMSVDERARKGLFLAFQYPQEINGVTVSDFLKTAINSRREKPISLFKFIKTLDENAKDVGFNLDMVHRSINEGFSGGEKKRNEILQMCLLEPKIAMLDEIDSGLDVDGLHQVSNSINKLKEKTNLGLVIISHYARLYTLVKPDFVHVVVNGKIAISGGNDIIEKIDQKGYEWIKEELGIEIAKEEAKPILLESCAHKGTN